MPEDGFMKVETCSCYIVLINTLTPELNPSAQRCLSRIFTGILIFKGLTARRLCKSFGVKRLITFYIKRLCWSVKFIYFFNIHINLSTGHPRRGQINMYK
jgi:hypothetical protein